MQAISGYLENGRFIPYGVVTLPNHTDAILVIQDIVQSLKHDNNRAALEKMDCFADDVRNEEKELRVAWLKRLDAAIGLSLDEDLPDIPRSTIMREPLDLAD